MSTKPVPFTKPDSDLAHRFRIVVATWAHCQFRLIALATEVADSVDWAIDGSPTAAHWIGHVADVEPATAREWIRIGNKLAALPAIAAAFTDGDVSYTKVRVLTRVATPQNEAELLAIAARTPAAELRRAIAEWMHRVHTPEGIAAHQHVQRSVTWRSDPDGMVVFTLRLPPLLAARLIAVLTVLLMRTTTSPGRATVAQRHADGVGVLLDGASTLDTEIVLHVRGDGCTLDDGSPIPSTVVESIADTAFIRALIHDSKGRPMDATNRRRHPTTRQKRLVTERDRTCVDCGRADLLEHDHEPPHHITGHTLTTELELRCAPCHQRRQPAAAWIRRTDQAPERDQDRSS